MTGLRFVASAAFVCMTSLLPLSNASGQQVNVMGEARGDDHGTPPPGWTVIVTSWINGVAGETINSNGVNYIYPLQPPGPAKLVYSREGYRSRGEDVIFTGGNPLRKDVVLERIKQYRTGSLPERSARLRQELDQQAELARMGGAAAQEVFRWNLQLYERLYRNTELSRDVREFSSRPDIISMVRTDGFLERDPIYERLLDASPNADPAFSPDEITAALRARSLGATIRSHLIWMLIDDAPTGDERQRALDAIRAVALEEDPGLSVAAFAALLRLGDPNDVALVLRAAVSTNSVRATSAINAIRISRLDEGADALIAIVQSGREPQLRAAAAYALASVAPERGTPALLRTLSSAEQPPVMLSTLDALGESRSLASADPTLQAALRRLLSHPNGEIRVEAAKVLQASGQAP